MVVEEETGSSHVRAVMENAPHPPSPQMVIDIRLSSMAVRGRWRKVVRDNCCDRSHSYCLFSLGAIAAAFSFLSFFWLLLHDTKTNRASPERPSSGVNRNPALSTGATQESE